MGVAYPAGILASTKTSDAEVLDGKGKFWGFKLKAEGANAELVIYDNTAASGTILAKGGAAVDNDADELILPRPIDVANGIYVDVTNCHVTVFYQSQADFDS